MDKNKQKFISEKIAKLIGEGYSRAQASAISYNMAEKQYAQQGEEVKVNSYYREPVYIQKGVTDAKGKDGVYLYYKKRDEPGFNVETDREFVSKDYFTMGQYEPELRNEGLERYFQKNPTQRFQQAGMYGEDAFLSDIYGADDFINKYGNRSNIVNTSALGNPNYDSMYMNMTNEEEQLKNPDYNKMYMSMTTEEEQLKQPKPETVTQDINRVNIVNPFGGVSMENALNFAGRGFNEKNPWKAIGMVGAGASLAALKGTRSFLTGYASSKEDARVQDEYYRKMFENRPNYTYTGGYGVGQQGKEITNAEALTGQFLTENPNGGNLNVEGGEFKYNPREGVVQEVVGDDHLEYKDGKAFIGNGTNVFAKEGDKFLSKYTKIPLEDLKELKESYDIPVKKGMTFADFQKAVNRKIKLTAETKHQTELLEKVAKQEKNTKDETTKGLNIEAYQAEIQKSKSKLAMLNQVSGEVFEDLFARQERIPKKGGPGDLFDKNGKKVTEYTDGTKVAQQGGYMEIAKKYGISPERAEELMMQQGGEPMEEEQQISPEQIVQTYAQATQQDPQEIVAQLQQMQPEEQQQALMQMAEQLQGGGQEQGQGGDIMQMIAGALQQGASPEEVMQGLVSQGMPEQEAAQAIEAVMGQNQGQEMAQQGGYKVSQGKNKYKTATREKQSTVEGKAYGAVEPQEALQNLYNNFPDLVETELKDYVTVDKKGNVTFNNKLSFTQQQKQIGNLQGKMNTRMNASADVILNNPELFPSDVVTEAKRYKEQETFLDKTPGAEDPANSVRGFDEKLGNFTSGRYIMGVNLLTPEDLKKASEKGIKTYKQLKASDFYDSLSPESKKRIDNMSNIVKDSDADFLISEFQPEAAKKQYDFKDKNVEVRNNVRNMFPMLPTDLKLAPSALTPLAKEQINFLRKEATKVTPENMLANQEMMRQVDASRLQQTGMSPQQQEALMASGMASNALVANDAIAKTEMMNMQSQDQADTYNLQADAKEKIMNSQFNQDYQNKMLAGMANTERDWRRFYNENNAQNRANYQDVEEANLLNTMQDQYAYVPGVGVQFLNNQAADIGRDNLTDEEYKIMTAQEEENYKRQRMIADKKKAYFS
jgi:hypothetical protein